MLRVVRYSGILLLAMLPVPRGAAQDSAPTVRLNSTVPAAASRENVTYGEFVILGSVALAAKNSSAPVIVGFQSRYFSGLEHIKVAQGAEFRKAGRVVAKYPAEFILSIQPDTSTELLNSPAQMIPTPRAVVRIAPELRPQHVRVRWIDSRQQVVAEKSADLEEQTEAWSELRQPIIRFQTKITNVDVRLACGVEVSVFGEGNTLLGIVRGAL